VKAEGEQKNYGIEMAGLGRKHAKRVVGLSCETGLPEADDASLEEIMGGRLAEMREAGMPEDTAS